jgi:hypothetical protein
VAAWRRPNELRSVSSWPWTMPAAFSWVSPWRTTRILSWFGGGWGGGGGDEVVIVDSVCTATNGVIDSLKGGGKEVCEAIEMKRPNGIAGEVFGRSQFFFLSKIDVFARTRQQLVSLRGGVVDTSC